MTAPARRGRPDTPEECGPEWECASWVRGFIAVALERTRWSASAVRVVQSSSNSVPVGPPTDFQQTHTTRRCWAVYPALVQHISESDRASSWHSSASPRYPETPLEGGELAGGQLIVGVRDAVVVAVLSDEPVTGRRRGVVDSVQPVVPRPPAPAIRFLLPLCMALGPTREVRPTTNNQQIPNRSPLLGIQHIAS